MATTATVITVVRTAAGFVLRIAGRGTMKESRAVLAFAERALAGGGTLALDLSACDHLDSTFLGTLVSLQQRFGGKEQPPRFALAAPAAGARKAMGATRLDAFFTIVDDVPASDGSAAVPLPVPEKDENPAATARHIMEAHRRLAELGGPNQAVFQAIADRCAKELGDQD